MALIQFRNAYYRGWFAARARRPAPACDTIEDHFFIDMGFADGKFSGGEPLVPLTKGNEAQSPADLTTEAALERLAFSTRYVQEGSTAAPEKHPPAQVNVGKQLAASSAESVAEAGLVEDSQGDTGNPQLPQKKPNYRLPSRPVYSSGKRRATRFSG